MAVAEQLIHMMVGNWELIIELTQHLIVSDMLLGDVKRYMNTAIPTYGNLLQLAKKAVHDSHVSTLAH